MGKRRRLPFDQASISTCQTSLGRTLIQATFRKIAIFIGYFGVILVMYGTVMTIWVVDYPVLERYAVFVSSLLTILGAVLTAVGIYFPLNKKPPEFFSLYVSAPAVIILGLTAALYLAARHTISSHVINGFALMAIAGALFRIQEKPNVE